MTLWKKKINLITDFFSRTLFPILCILFSLSTLILSTLSPVFTPTLHKNIPVEQIFSSDGFIYSTPTRFIDGSIWHVLPDIEDDETRSSLSLSEDGAPLGPAHSLHADIAELGQGRFSHWRGDHGTNYVIFSTSDNSDPRSNGKIYSVSYHVTARPVYLKISLVLWIISFSLLLLKFGYRFKFITDAAVFLSNILNSVQIGRLLIAIFSIYILSIYVFFLPDNPILAPDSGSYLYLSPAVSVGYPLFLHAIYTLSDSLTWIPKSQLIILIISIIYLFETTVRLLRFRCVATILALSLLAYSPAMTTAITIEPEALFISLILATLSSGIALLNEPEKKWPLYIMALSTAAIIFVRPAGYFIVAAICLLPLFGYVGFRRFLIHAALPMVGLIVIGMVGGQIIRGTGTQSIAGMAIFPHISEIFDADYVGPAGKELAMSVESVTKPYSAAMAAEPDWKGKYFRELNQFNIILAESSDVINKSLGIDDSNVDAKRKAMVIVNSIMKDFSVSTILHRPTDYAGIVARTVAAGWRFCILPGYSPMPRAVLDAYRQHEDTFRFLVRTKDLTLTPYDSDLLARDYPILAREDLPLLDLISEWLARYRAVIYALACLSLIAIPVALIRRRNAKVFLALALAGAMIHGAVMLTATATVFIPRYGLPIDVLVIVGLGLTLDIAATYLHRAVVGLVSAATPYWRRAAALVS